MGKKRKGSSIMVTWDCDPKTDLQDGFISLRPCIKVVGSFDLAFSRLFAEFFRVKFSDFVSDKLVRYLPGESDEASDQEVAE